MALNKKRPVRVIWVLRGTEGMKLALPAGYDREKFWVEDWLPQADILAHPVVTAGISHCGFGGTTEFIMAGKPFLTFPHCGDQRANADNAIEAGAALPLFPTQLADRFPHETTVTYEEPVFSPEDVEQGFMRLLNEEKFGENARKLQLLANAAGGAERTVSAIEDYYVAALTIHKRPETHVRHIVFEQLVNYAWKSGPLHTFFWLSVVVTLVFCAAVFEFKGILHYAKDFRFNLTSSDVLVDL